MNSSYFADLLENKKLLKLENYTIVLGKLRPKNREVLVFGVTIPLSAYLFKLDDKL